MLSEFCVFVKRNVFTRYERKKNEPIHFKLFFKHKKSRRLKPDYIRTAVTGVLCVILNTPR